MLHRAAMALAAAATAIACTGAEPSAVPAGTPDVATARDSATPTATERSAATSTPSPTASLLPAPDSPQRGEFAPAWAPRAPETYGRGLTATLLDDGRVLLTGGQLLRSDRVVPDAELFDPATRRVVATGEMSEPRTAHSATLLTDGRVLIAGGTGPGFTDDPLASAEVYDPTAGRFSPVGSMEVARYLHGAVRLDDGRVLVVGGGAQAGQTAEIFDPATGSFERTGDPNVGRLAPELVLLADGRVLVSGYGPLELYDPVSGSFRLIDAEPPGDRPTATLLTDGRVLLVGGSDRGQFVPGGPNSHGSGPATRQAVVFDPTAESLLKAGETIEPRQDHAAVRLQDGRVLVVGGAQDVHHELPLLASAEMFDPATERFTPAGAMAHPRFGHELVLLGDGTVLAVGVVSTSAEHVGERYRPPARGGAG